MSWQKEHGEHPWTTKEQAKRIASDHAKKSKPKPRHTSSKIGPLQTASKDFSLLNSGAKRIAYQRKP